MKKILLAISFFALMHGNAQLQESWKHEITEKVEWQKVSTLGNYLINTDQGLKSLDPDTGNELWNLPTLASVDEAAFEEIPNTPLAKVSYKNDIYILNMFDGKILFDASKEGFEKIKEEHILYQGNVIWITGKTAEKKELHAAVDLDAGTVLWKSSEELGRVIALREIDASSFLLVSLFNSYKINSQTGDVIWSNPNSAEAESVASMGKFGAALQKMAEKVVDLSDIKIDFNIDPEGRYFSIGSEEKKETETSSGEVIVSYSCNYQAYDLNSGKYLLKKPYKVPGNIGLSLWHDGKLIVLPYGKGSSKLNMIDPNTGVGFWGKKGKGIKMKGGIISYTQVEQGLFLISDRGGKTFMDYLDLNTGNLSFDKSIKVRGAVGFTLMTPKGMAYATPKELNIIDLNTGEVAFEKDYRTHYDLVRTHNGTIYFMDTKELTLKGIDQQTGLQNYISKEEVKFEEKEWVENLEFKENGIVLSAAQNFVLFDNEGNKVYQTWLPSPREAGWKRALLYSSAVLSMYTSAVTGVAGAVTTAAGATQEQGSTEQAVLVGAGSAYTEMSKASGALAKTALNAANKRFKATAQARDYAIVLTNLKDDGGIQLVKMNKLTGATESSILLGKDRKPNYTIDLVAGKLFLLKDGVIRAYDL